MQTEEQRKTAALKNLAALFKKPENSTNQLAPTNSNKALGSRPVSARHPSKNKIESN